MGAGSEAGMMMMNASSAVARAKEEQAAGRQEEIVHTTGNYLFCLWTLGFIFELLHQVFDQYLILHVQTILSS